VHSLRSGFRAVFRQPALILAEIAWRWSFGAAAWVLVVLTARAVLAGIDISEAEYLLARHSDLFLIADACARILSQALPAFARAAAIIVPALALIWIFAVTLGRAATLKALFSVPLEFVGPGALAGAAPEPFKSSTAAGAHARGKMRFSSLLFLYLLRALFTLATLLAFIGTMILAAITFPAQGADPSTAALIWVILAALAAVFWTVINWFLALAPIWIVRDGRDPFRAIADSLALFRRDSGAYVSAAWWFGVIRGLALLTAFIAALVAASVLETSRAVAAASLLIALLYFAVADFLYVARIAAFVALADESSQPSAVSIQPPAPEPQPAIPEA
jgi:hypothetical protein